MINIEDYLQQIDESFKDKGPKDIYMYYVMIFGVLFAISYLLFWESAELAYQESDKRVTEVKAKILEDNNYLAINTIEVVNKIENTIKLYNKQLEEKKEHNEYIKLKIEAISSLVYNERTWGEYLHSISTNAKKYNIKIKHFTNEYAKKDEDFGHILDIVLETTGSYQNTLKFINSLEQSELVVDLHDLNIKAQTKLNTNLNISVWGITY